jgi:hypothetical protein
MQLWRFRHLSFRLSWYNFEHLVDWWGWLTFVLCQGHHDDNEVVSMTTADFPPTTMRPKASAELVKSIRRNSCAVYEASINSRCLVTPHQLKKQPRYCYLVMLRELKLTPICCRYVRVSLGGSVDTIFRVIVAKVACRGDCQCCSVGCDLNFLGICLGD